MTHIKYTSSIIERRYQVMVEHDIINLQGFENHIENIFISVIVQIENTTKNEFRSIHHFLRSAF